MAAGVGPMSWAKKGLGLTGGPSFGAGAAGVDGADYGRSSVGGGSGLKRGMREVMAKFKGGGRFGGKTSAESAAMAAAAASEAVIMGGVGLTESGPVTVRE